MAVVDGPGTRVALLGASTTDRLKTWLQFFFHRRGQACQVYESDFARYEEEALFPPPALLELEPEAIYLHVPTPTLEPPVYREVESFLTQQAQRFQRIWAKLRANFPHALIVQANFAPLLTRAGGNQSALHPGNPTRLVERLNASLYEIEGLTLLDAHHIATTMGTNTYYQPSSYYASKIVESEAASMELAFALHTILEQHRTGGRRALILDLDNTLWGGEIGEGEVELGPDSPLGEAHQAFQSYVKTLQARGIVLAIASKNDPQNARRGLQHQHSRLQPEDFAAIEAHWEPKSTSVTRILQKLNLLAQACVFVDDNPVELAEVQAHHPDLITVDASDIESLPAQLDQALLFDPRSGTREDAERTRYYQADAQRQEARSDFATYGDFLDSLQMRASLAPLCDSNFARAHQLIAKTNQFNLNGIRLTEAELKAYQGQPGKLGLVIGLSDRFGDNGDVAVVLGTLQDRELVVDTWVMSCRVFGRTLEHAILSHLAASWTVRARAVATDKNSRSMEFFTSPQPSPHHIHLEGSLSCLAETKS